MVQGMDGAHETVLWRVEPQSSMAEADDFDHLSRLLDRPKIKIERKLSFDERSLSELSITGNLRAVDSYDSLCSPGAGRSVLNTPNSSARNSFEPHPMVADAWDALRRSIVFFRGQQVGTIAAVDHAAQEALNYDQVHRMSRFLKRCHLGLVLLDTSASCLFDLGSCLSRVIDSEY